MKKGVRIVWDRRREEPLARYVGGSLVKSYQTQESGGGLEEWTVKQLQAYAEEQGIDLEGVTRKADIIAAIEVTEGQEPDTVGDGDGEGGQDTPGGDSSGEDT